MNSTPLQSQAQSSTLNVSRLQVAINTISGLADESLPQIAAIAKLALAYLETPEGYQHPDNVAHALRAIWASADVLHNDIGYEAEQIGCERSDENQQRRWEAQRMYREQLQQSRTSALRKADALAEVEVEL